MTTPTHPTELTPRVTDEHRRQASALLSSDHGPYSVGLGREELAHALALAEQRGAARLAGIITEHAKDASEASAIYTAKLNVFAGRRDGRSRAAAAECAVAAGQASAVAQALRGVLSA